MLLCDPSDYLLKSIIAGGNVVLLYASRYHDVQTVVNLSGRYDLKKGIEERIGKDFIQRVKGNGFIDVKSNDGKFSFIELC